MEISPAGWLFYEEEIVQLLPLDRFPIKYINMISGKQFISLVIRRVPVRLPSHTATTSSGTLGGHNGLILRVGTVGGHRGTVVDSIGWVDLINTI